VTATSERHAFFKAIPSPRVPRLRHAAQQPQVALADLAFFAQSSQRLLELGPSAMFALLFLGHFHGNFSFPPVFAIFWGV
jgi:hypothetical protein